MLNRQQRAKCRLIEAHGKRAFASRSATADACEDARTREDHILKLNR
jgi:hypothetical protein